jgi:hypothetical protein
MPVAMLYRFEVWQGGEPRLVTQEEVSASTLAMLEPQLTSVPQRPLLARGPGWMIFEHYRAARQAAQVLGDTAASIELREVAAGDAETDSAWIAADGTRYALVPGGLAQRVK